MNPLLIGPLAEAIKAAISRIFPDPAVQADASYKLAALVQSGELAQLAADTDLAKAQIAVNATEAASDSTFKSGWRPFIGWTCGAAFAWNFVLAPAATWAAGIAVNAGYLPHAVTFAAADMSQMMPVLLGLLGMGALRTVEKVKGAS
jgi:hypothetical protein